MKKIIAILLIVVFSINSYALDINKSDDYQNYSLIFELDAPADLKLVYQSESKIIFDVPTEFTVTKNTPVSVNYDWVAWENSATGDLYYPGDKIKVEDTIYLKAVWEEKNDNYPMVLRFIMAQIESVIKKIFNLLGAYDVSKFSATINNCKLIVNGKDITDKVYVMIDSKTESDEVPFTSIVKELGATVEWKNENVVSIEYDGIVVDIDTSKEWFGEPCPPGTPKCTRRVVNGELIFDSDSIRGYLKNWFNASITVDYDQAIITVESY